MHIMISVQLIVKDSSPDAAERRVRDYLNQWFNDPNQQQCIPGDGFPNGALLYHAIVDVPMPIGKTSVAEDGPPPAHTPEADEMDKPDPFEQM